MTLQAVFVQGGRKHGRRNAREKIRDMLNLPFIKVRAPRRMVVEFQVKHEIGMDLLFASTEPVDQVIAAMLVLKQQVDAAFDNRLRELKKVKES